MKWLNPRVLLGAVFGFIREGWVWILLPTVVVLVIVGLIILFGDPYQRSALHGKFILIYSFFGG